MLSPRKGAAVPATRPDRTPSRPELVSSAPAGRRRLWWWALAVVLLAGMALLWQARRPTPQPAASKGQPSAIRTVKAGFGGLERTMRLSGVTAARNYASMVAPQMHGRGGTRSVSGMSGGGRSGGSSGGSSSSGGDSSSSRGGSSSASSGSSSGSGSSAASGSSAGDSGGMSGATGLSGSSAAVRTSTSRFSAPKSGSSTRDSGSSASSAASASMGSSGLGSTGGSLGAGLGGGDSSGSNFQLILQSLIKPGSRVKKGELLAEFDRQYMLNRLDDFRASLVQNEASLRKLDSDLDVDKQAHNQSITSAKAALDKALLDEKTTPVQSANQAEKLKLAVEEAQARYTQLLKEVPFKDVSQKAQKRYAELDAKQENIEFRRTEANVNRMVIRAPMDGITVMSTTFRGGEFGQIQQGDMIYPGQMFMQVVDPSSMVINASINQTDVETLRVGARAKVRFDAYPDLELPARVYAVGAIAKGGGFRASYVTNVPVVLRLEKMDPRVIPDMSVSADVILATEERQAALVPLEAVFRDNGTGKPFVFVQGTPEWSRREVDLGLRNNTHAVVRSGLRPGEVLAADWPIVEKK